MSYLAQVSYLVSYLGLARWDTSETLGDLGKHGEVSYLSYLFPIHLSHERKKMT